MVSDLLIKIWAIAASFPIKCPGKSYRQVAVNIKLIMIETSCQNSKNTNSTNKNFYIILVLMMFFVVQVLHA